MASPLQTSDSLLDFALQQQALQALALGRQAAPRAVAKLFGRFEGESAKPGRHRLPAGRFSMLAAGSSDSSPGEAP